MTQEPLDLIPPFDGRLYSEAWWQRVAPNLTLEGRALVQKTLTAAADRLEAAAAKLAEAEGLARRIEEAQSNLAEAQSELEEAQSKEEELDAQLEEAKAKSEEVGAKLAEAMLANAKSKRGEAEAKLVEVESKREEAKAQLEAALAKKEEWKAANARFKDAASRLFDAYSQMKDADSRMTDVSKELSIQKKKAESRAEFDRALRGLKAPTPKQIYWLENRPKLSPEEVSKRPLLDLSKILICHPETGQAIDWHKCEFPAVTFENAVFVGNITFEMAAFVGEANFEEANFTSEANFQGVKFTDKGSSANFKKAKFASGANFNLAKFAGDTIFIGDFSGETNFIGATFASQAYFLGANFASAANFRKASFDGYATFMIATFAGEARFDQAEFIDMAIFEGASFTGVADFHAARFGKTVIFGSSEWRAVPDFVGTAFKDGMAIADLDTLQTSLTNHTLDWRNDPTRTPITDRLQALRKMAHDADDRPRELDYFALELQSRYQAKKKIDDPTKNETWWLWLKQGLIWLYGGLWLKRLLIRLYGRFSDYGRGIGRPLWWLVWLWAGCALGYTLLIKDAPQIALWLCLAGWIGAAIELSRFDRRLKSNPNSKILRWVLWGACVGQWGWLLWSIPQYGNALLLSLVNALPALGVASEARKSSLETLYGSDVPAIVHGIGIFEGVAAILLLFLIGLGLRNRFRL